MNYKTFVKEVYLMLSPPDTAKTRRAWNAAIDSALDAAVDMSTNVQMDKLDIVEAIKSLREPEE